ncbi:hypothetical protein [Taklimakanibacter deserti]|uniref:hypothetical protein n=1 Tax=Taklimakanibacter deserti TaxID=2267839 RepID=UPI000E6540E5
MDAITPWDDADIERRRRENLKAVIVGMIGVDLTTILMGDMKLPGQFEALETLVRFKAWSAQPGPPKSSNWASLSAMDKLDQAHRRQAMHDAKLRGKA